MNDLRTAAQQALEALEKTGIDGTGKLHEAAITALKAALAEFNPDWDRIEPLQENLREHMAEIQRLRSELALQRLTDVQQEMERSIDSLKAALAEPEGGGNLPPPLPAEPVAWRWGYRSVTTGDIDWQGYVETPTHPKSPDVMQPLYTAPPQCKPLTEQEIINIGKAAEPVQLAYKRIGCVGHDCDECQHRALTEPVQEPVAWRYKPMIGSPWSLSDDGYYISCKRDKGYTVEPLYTTPPQRKPLSLKDVERLIYEETKINPNVADDRELLSYIVNAVRAIERAHGIGGQGD